jgi:quinol monooxygenase YgiN
MTIERRDFIGGSAAAAVLGAAAAVPAKAASSPPGRQMYGLIGRMVAKPGRRDALIAALLDGTGAMPGCLSYVVALDPADADAIWITEVWDAKASHEASLALPSVRMAIAKARPLIARIDPGTVTAPVGGYSLVAMR